MELALFQPDIPQNTGTLMRLCACMEIPLNIIEPCGFIISDKNLKRAGMDYMEHLELICHSNWENFKIASKNKRLILMTTKTKNSFLDFNFEPDDILIAGRESAGAPDYVHEESFAEVTIPMSLETRSLNIAIASSMILSEALRQTNGFPKNLAG